MWTRSNRLVQSSWFCLPVRLALLNFPHLSTLAGWCSECRPLQWAISVAKKNLQSIFEFTPCLRVCVCVTYLPYGDLWKETMFHFKRKTTPTFVSWYFSHLLESRFVQNNYRPKESVKHFVRKLIEETGRRDFYLTHRSMIGFYFPKLVFEKNVVWNKHVRLAPWARIALISWWLLNSFQLL